MESLHQDRQLIEQLKLGSKEAFRNLFETFAPKIHAFALSFVKNDADAEELLQEVFLKIWEIRENLDSSRNIKSFLFKICINLIYDLIRRKNIEKAYLDFALNKGEINSNSTWHEVVYHEMQNNLQHLLAGLSEQKQQIFRLSKEEGLTNEEIASRLQISKRAVENHLFRTLSYLKEKLGQSSLPGLLFFSSLQLDFSDSIDIGSTLFFKIFR